MKKLLLSLLFLFPLSAFAQTAALPVYDCTNNGIQAKTSGMKSTNYQLGVIPYCTVTVYLTGTQTIATTSPQTPLTANSNGSIPPIYVATGVGYDVTFSGGISPNTYTTPVTLTDVMIGGGAGCPLSGCTFTGPVVVNSTLSVKNNASIGARFDVLMYGAKGDNSTDDTAAIQAAFTACWNNITEPFGGVVEFPGPHTYVISSTINAYDGCKIEGVTGSSTNGGQTPRINWNGAAAAVGTVVNITSFTLAANSTPLYTPAYPNVPGVTQNRTTANIGTFTGTNTLVYGQWVDFEGFSTTEGMGLNRCIGQVVSSTGSAFTALIPCSLNSLGTVTDAGTATTVTVGIAFDAAARYQQSVENLIVIGGNYALHPLSVGLFYSSRVDTGTYIGNVSAENTTMWGYYFAHGGININFDNGWRADSNLKGGIYWRIDSQDSFGIANGTIDNSSTTGTGGSAIVLDNTAGTGDIQFTARNIKIEINNGMAAGVGALYLIPGLGANTSDFPQFKIDLENVWFAPCCQSTGGVNITPLSVNPPRSDVLNLTAINSQFVRGGGANTSLTFTGVNALNIGNLTGDSGYTPFLSFSGPFYTMNLAQKNNSPSQILGDFNIGNGRLYQYGIAVSMLLYSDTAYAALPNGTTLYAGQVLAPPAYWKGANGKRYALDVVYQSGTTGTLNSGSTTCSAVAAAHVMTCTSATDLTPGQYIFINGFSQPITWIDATNPAAVLVYTYGNIGGAGFSSQALTYLAPTLGLEMQLPTKSSAAPSTLAWSQGDWEQNSGATSGGICGWVNTGAGTPGTWTAIPCGDATGKIAMSQLSGLSIGTVTSASGTVTTAHTFSVSYTGTPNCVATPLSNSGAWYFSTVPTSSSTGIITYVTAGAQTFNVQCVGVGGAW